MPRVSSNNCNLIEAPLEFSVVWNFFFPLFANTAITEHLGRASPDPVSELKDTFIALVVEGPFPHMMNGIKFGTIAESII
jgi:hypothetical protein